MERKTETRPAEVAEELSVEVVTDRQDLDRHRSQWHQLRERSPHAEVFQSYEWVTSWLDVFWKGKPISFAFVSEGDRLRAVAPFVHDTAGELCCKGGRAVPNNSKGCSNLLYDGDPFTVLDAIFRHLADQEQSFRVNFGRIRTDSSLNLAFDSVCREHALWSKSQASETWSIASLSGSWEEYLQSRPTHVRKELRRKEARLRRKARVAVRVIEAAHDVPGAIRDVVAIERKSWKWSRGLAISSEQDSTDFYPLLARRLAPRGWLRIYILEIDGTPAAHIIGAVSKNEILALTTSFDLTFKDLSPGTVLFACALRGAGENGYASFNFMSGRARWKDELSGGTREHFQRCLFSRIASRCGYCLARDGFLKPFFRSHLPKIVAAKNWLTTHPPE